jgi:hypothetical protein
LSIAFPGNKKILKVAVIDDPSAALPGEVGILMKTTGLQFVLPRYNRFR